MNEADTMFPTTMLKPLGWGWVREKGLTLIPARKSPFETRRIEVGGESLGRKVVCGGMAMTLMCVFIRVIYVTRSWMTIL